MDPGLKKVRMSCESYDKLVKFEMGLNLESWRSMFWFNNMRRFNDSSDDKKLSWASQGSPYHNHELSKN